jgi:hypothetical protein
MASSTRVWCDHCGKDDGSVGKSVFTHWRRRDLPKQYDIELCDPCERKFFRAHLGLFRRWTTKLGARNAK